MRVEARFFWLAIAALCLAGPARAGGSKQAALGNDLVVSVRWPWPDMLNHGAQPFFVDVWNRGAEEKLVELTFNLYSGVDSALIAKSLVVAAGERSAFEVCAPVFARGPNAYDLIVESGGEREYIPGVGASIQPELGSVNVLVLSRNPLDPGLAGTWAATLSSAAEPLWRQPMQRVAGGGYGGMILRPAAVPPASPGNRVHVATVLFEDLPRNAACYASIDGLVVDLGAGLPDAERMAAITSFARQGGLLVFRGRGARAALAGQPELASWLEPRFSLGATARPFEAHLCGQGLLAIDEGEGSLDPSRSAALAELLFSQAGDLSLVPRIDGGRAREIDVELPGLELPQRALMGVLILFAIVIGPLNLWFVKRSKRPALLLVTVPAIALLFSLALFAYGALAQGLDVRARSVTLTLLDQQNHRSTSLETRQLFAGLSPGRRLEPGPGAWLFPDPEAGSYQERKSYRLDLTAATRLEGDYLPVRTPTRQSIVVDRAARQRVELVRDGERWRAQFGLGTGVRSFVFRDGDGKLWKLGASASDGGTALLEPAAQEVDTGRADMILALPLPDAPGGLPRGSYVAVLDGFPFGDDLGVPARAIESEHTLVGIVEIAGTGR